MTHRHRTDSAWRSVQVGLLVAVLVAATTTVARAQAPGVFEVKGVAVDVTAKTAAQARERALAEGEGVAFRRLLERLTLRADHPRLPKPNSREISFYIKDFAVADEKTSPVRYLARLSYRFQAGLIRRLLTDSDLPFAETPSKPVMVLPVYQAAGALLLWDDPNPWREAWKAVPPLDGLVPLALPLSDLADIAAIGAEQAVKGDARRLNAVATRYGAGDVIVAHATLGISTRLGRPELEVFVTRYGTALQEQTIVKSFLAAEGEGVDSLLGRAAVELARQVEDNWKKDNLLEFETSAVAAAKVPIQRLQDWLEVRKRLSGIAVVDRVDMILISLDEVRINIHYFGAAEQLVLAFEQADLLMSAEGGEWALSLAASSPLGKS
jgi:hypothetical protein